MFVYCLNSPILLCDSSGTCSYISSLGGWIDCRSPSCQTSANYTTNVLYYILTDMGNPKDHGSTFSVGGSIGGTNFNQSQGVSGCLSVDSSNNYAFQKTDTYGAATGTGGSGALVLTWTNASNVQDLAGPSESTGVTICSGLGISIDYITFVPASQPNSTRWGISISICGGGEAEVHKNYNYTTSTKSWNLWHSIRDVLFGS